MGVVFKRYYFDNKPTDYIISSNGDIYSLKTNKFLKPSVASHGYYNLNIYIQGTKFSMLIHRMVTETFIPVHFEDEVVVNHIDGDKHNNYYTNLEWCTYSHNNSHAIRIGINKKPPSGKGEHNSNAKYTDDDIHKICQYMCDGLKNTDISDLMQINIDTIIDIRLGRSHTHITSIYNIPQNTSTKNKKIRQSIKQFITTTQIVDVDTILDILEIENIDKYRRIVRYIIKYYLKK